MGRGAACKRISCSVDVTTSNGFPIKRVLVTGGSGFIGTNIIDFYLEAGIDILNVDHSPPRKQEHASVWKQAELLDRTSLRDAVSAFAPTHVLHMAARTDLLGRRLAEYSANTSGVENLIAALADVKSLERVVLASSRMVCEIGYQPRSENDYCPTTVYGESKVETERIIRAQAGGLPWTIVRPSSIWGPWFDVPYKDFFLSIARGRYFHLGRRRVRKSFGFVGNSVHQLHRLMLAPLGRIHGRTLYLADYPPLEVRDWAEEIRGQMDARPIRTAPYPALKAAALTGDVLQRLGRQHVPLTSFRLDNLLTEMVYDLDPLEEIVGPLPHSLAEGTARTVAWLREKGEIPGRADEPTL